MSAAPCAAPVPPGLSWVMLAWMAAISSTAGMVGSSPTGPARIAAPLFSECGRSLASRSGPSATRSSTDRKPSA